MKRKKFNEIPIAEVELVKVDFNKIAYERIKKLKHIKQNGEVTAKAE